MKTLKKVSLVSALMVALLTFYVAPVFASPALEGASWSGVIYAYLHPNEVATPHTGGFTAEEAKEWNAEISAAWSSPFSNHTPGTLSAPFGIDNSSFKYAVGTGEVIGTNPGYGDPMGYGDSCERPTYYTTIKDIPAPTSCPVPCDPHDDNGHGNDDDHDDDSNPGHGGGGHGQ